MKLLIFILLPFFSFAQATTYWSWDKKNISSQLHDYYGDSIILNGGANGKWLVRFRKANDKDSIADVSWDGIYDTLIKINKYKEANTRQSTYEQGDSIWLVSLDTSKVKVYKTDDISPKLVDSLKARVKTIPSTNQGYRIYKETEALSVYDDNPLKAIESPMRCLFTPDKKEIIVDKNDPSWIDSKTMNWTEKPKYDTIGPFWKQVSDTTCGYNPVMAMQVYEYGILEKHNNTEGVIDPYARFGFKYQEWTILKHVGWLDIKKKPLKYKVWQNISSF